jgi:UDP-N-acetylmuramate--alanine ligase
VEPIFVPELRGVPQALGAVLEDGDLVLTLGAGDIGAFAAGLPATMGKLRSLRLSS